jgi:hypothetical protein
MTVFLGVAGYVELQRSLTGEVFTSVINPSDVNPTKDRFSFDFPEGMLLTGDRIEIKTTDGGLLDFVAASGWANSTQQNDGNWYINVDELGGIKLYDSFYNALNGEASGRVDLETPSRDIPVEVRNVDANSKILGRVTGYEFNNAREAVDVTELSDEFRKQHSSLISGNGSIDCLFDYRAQGNKRDGQTAELASYMHQLVLRQKLGAQFAAKLFVVGSGWGEGSDGVDDRVWFEFQGLITNAGISLSPDQVVASRFDFVTTGAIALKAATAAGNYLLQQNSDYILLEQDTTAKLELEYD